MTTKERPILFSGPMVRALLDGRKTQTRRVVKPDPASDINPVCLTDKDRSVWQWATVESRRRCRYGLPGDRLWVKETWGKSTDARGTGVVRFRADDSARFVLAEDGGEGDWCRLAGVADSSRCHPCDRWRPSIHMPRWASRITLEVVGVRAERVQSISEADAIAEGFAESFDSAGACHERTTARENFLHLFYDLNKRAPRDQNPWVWVVEFKRIGGNP